MSSSDRQTRLLVAEDWKRIYQGFRNADFQSYDFDNLRRSMINYLRQNYPEDFNDYIESSEYLALIDMIAFLGQNLSFRVDLNARENFLETAERRESVLRLARMLSYNPKRNQAANGLMKITTVKTTETLFDSAGLNLSNNVIKWNDTSNTNYVEQFTKILNAALPVNNSIGNPLKNANIEGIQTQKYRFNATNTDTAIFPFTKNIEGNSVRFEVVSADISNTTIKEESPLPGTSPAFLYRDDGQGAGSSNSGFFMHVRQGALQTGNFSVKNPVPNQVVSIDASNINNTDVWLYNVDTNGFETTSWTQLTSTEGNNIIYNSLFNQVRNIFSVESRIGDRINLVFSDGVFGNLPAGNFKIYYRTSINKSLAVTPGQIGNINIAIPYQSKSGSQETITLGLRLPFSITNGTGAETNAEIKANAPASYYTQNRLITGEDYNIGPLSVSQEIIKTKSVNRISSGISRYLDIKDPSGKYSTTKLFADDGVIYKELYETKQDFNFSSQSDIEGIIVNTLQNVIRSSGVKNYYISQFSDISVLDLGASWNSYQSTTNSNLGTLEDIDGNKIKVGAFTANNLKTAKRGTMLKFTPPAGFHFMKNNEHGLMQGAADHPNAVEYKWTQISNVVDDGTSIDAETNTGGITLTDFIPTGAILTEIVPTFSTFFSNDLKTQIIDQAFAYKDFALRYDRSESVWKLILAENINTISSFSLGKAGDITGQNLDTRWLLYFKTDGEKYTLTTRNLRYIFESEDEIRFFFDSADKIYDPKTGKIIRDTIKILDINTKPQTNIPFTTSFDWNISGAYRDKEGYVDSRKIQIEFFDLDNDGVIDDPDLFNQIVEPNTDPQSKLIFLKRYVTTDGVEEYRYYDNSDNTIQVKTNEKAIGAYSQYDNPTQIFYLFEEKIFKQLNANLNNLTVITDYKAYTGRNNLRFSYRHVADSNYRIDPAVSNIIDTYLLTKNYDTNIRQFLNGNLKSLPLPQSNDELFRNYGGDISKIKSITDEVIYHPVKYKILFGKKAKEDLQVIFKIVRNKDVVVNDNELKADVVNSIDRFFAIENWDFGETFYFQELAAYIINQLTPKLVSIVVVPRQGSQSFGSLFEIRSEPDEIFISGANVSDIEIIQEHTASQLQAAGNVLTNFNNATSQISSASAVSNISSSTSSTSTNSNSPSSLGSSSSSSSSGSSSSSSSSSSSGSSSSGSSGGGYSY